MLLNECKENKLPQVQLLLLTVWVSYPIYSVNPLQKLIATAKAWVEALRFHEFELWLLPLHTKFQYKLVLITVLRKIIIVIRFIFTKINSVVCKALCRASLVGHTFIWWLKPVVLPVVNLFFLAHRTWSKALMTRGTKLWTSAKSVWFESVLKTLYNNFLSRFYDTPGIISLYRAGRKPTQTTKAAQTPERKLWLVWKMCDWFVLPHSTRGIICQIT